MQTVGVQTFLLFGKQREFNGLFRRADANQDHPVRRDVRLEL
jgi:hypothetical protein